MWKDGQSGKIYILSLFANKSILKEVESALFKEKKALEIMNTLKSVLFAGAYIKRKIRIANQMSTSVHLASTAPPLPALLLGWVKFK